MTLEQKLLKLKEQARSNKETSIPNSVNYRVYLHKEKAYDKALTLAKEAKEGIVAEMWKHRKGTYARNKKEISCVWLMDADIIIKKHIGKFPEKEKD